MFDGWTERSRRRFALSRRSFRRERNCPSQPAAEWRKRFRPDGMKDCLVCQSEKLRDV
jgi:hypothetical protein